MAKRKRYSNQTCAPVSIGTSQEPASYAYVQQLARQQTADACDTLIREVSERLITLQQKVQSLRYNN